MPELTKERGFMPDRFEMHKAERIFAEEWDEQNSNFHTAEYVLSDQPGARVTLEDQTQFDINAMMQWLGTPCGQAFIRDTKEKCLKEGIRLLF